MAAALMSGASLAQPAGNSGVVPDDDLTLVVGTHFVLEGAAGASPTALFREERVPTASFNETDHCIDQMALEYATEYFNALGRVMGKAGHYYFVPDSDIEQAISACEKQHKGPPKAFAAGKTKVLAFGKVLPTTEAPALEEALR